MSNKNNQYERIASAVYLITSFFADAEPLKWRLRGLASDLVSQSVKDKGSVSADLSSLFNIARNSGIVSDINHNIISTELGRIELELAKPVEIPPLQISEPKKVVDEPKSLNLEPKIVEKAQVPEVETKISYLPEFKDKTSGEKPSLREFGAVSVKKNNRQSIIIGLLKRKKEIMIKDVSPLISNCSEKTIQRELSEMVSSGVLTKIGEKRWTKYSLA